MSAGPAVSVSAASRLSPAARCPSDPLSVALSFLGSRDFAAASRVSRHWRRAAELQSAWPEFSVQSLISGLIEDEYHWTQSRSARVRAHHVRAGALERFAQSPKWRRLSELHVNGNTWAGEIELSLSQVAQLPQLQSLCLKNLILSDVAAAFSSLAPRLQALKCHSGAESHLHLLTNLRVLTLPLVDGQALLPLHQLEYLQLHDFDAFSRDRLLAIRRLSVQHRLRHLSLITSYRRAEVNIETLFAELDGADAGLAPAALVSIRVFGMLSEASRSALLSLPNLTRLHWHGNAAVRESTAPSQSSLSPSPSPLQQLHLDFDLNGRGDAVQLLQQAAVRAPQLRELHMRCLPPSFAQLIRPLRSLRLLDIELSESSSLPPELAQSLASLPLFTELVVREEIWRPRPFQLTLATLRCIAESRSWRLISVLGWPDPPLLTLPDDVDAQLAEQLADFRVLCGWHCGTSRHRLVTAADGSATWQQTTI